MHDPNRERTSDSEDEGAPSDAMARADVANGERLEQSEEHPAGEEHARTNRAEESPT
jgi:hypothetical protein